MRRAALFCAGLGFGLSGVLACSSRARPREDDASRAAVTSVRGTVSDGGRPDAGFESLDAGALDGGDGGARDAGSVTSSVAIVDAPMVWSDERAALTLAYRRQHSDPAAADLRIEPRVIVLHYTGGGSAIATRRYFDNARIEAARPALARAGAVNVSAHFVVDRDGTIYQLQPTDRFARHCIGLNHVAIGVENVGDEARWPLTDAQVESNAALIRVLAGRHRIARVLGHHEVMALRDDPDFVERDRGYRNDKPDPGPRFMARVRARIDDLGLAGR